MNRGQLRVTMRRYLAESRSGIWKDDDLNAYLNEACDEHAFRAYSVRKTVHVSSLFGVQEYALPDDFGELMAVRYQYEGHQGTRGIDYVTKQVVLDWGYSTSDLGDPDCYYKDEDSSIGDKIGLFPIPNKPRVLDRVFEGNCPQFTPMLDNRDAVYPNTPTEFMNYGEYSITDASEQIIPGTALDPCRVWVSQIDFYLRREGYPYPGQIFLDIREPGNAANIHISKPIPAAYIDAQPAWIPFDLTQNPLMIDENEVNYEIRLRGDGDYLFPLGEALETPEAVVNHFGGRGIMIGTSEENGADIAFFRMHRLRNDIEVEYYRNVCDPMEEDDDVPQVYQRYHKTLWKMGLEKAYSKGGFNMALAEYWGNKAESEIIYARTQAVIPTAGHRREIRPGTRRVLTPNFQYDPSTGRATVRIY